MKEKKAFLITDLGPGDGGKGGVVHSVCCFKKAHTILKVGGAQGNHGVRTSRGEHYNFSQFGCGTFEGIKTHITNLMVIEPLRLMHEAETLATEWRISDIFSYLTVDERCLCTTPFHTIASRLRELARKNNPKGTVGIGVGEAALDAELHPDLTIYVKDILKPNLIEKLEAVRLQKMTELANIVNQVHNLSPSDQKLAEQEIALLKDPLYVEWIAKEFKRMAEIVKIVGASYLAEKILLPDGVIVVESSHGILTDKYYGFHPNTSRLRTIPMRTVNLLKECGYSGEVINLGVTRAYQIRHGAGPMVTATPALSEKLLPGSHKDNNRWQGKVRVGPLDLVMLRYAIEVCGGPSFFKGIALTWFDQIPIFGQWDLCRSYEGTSDSKFFLSSERIKVCHGSDINQLSHQQALGEQLRLCKPNILSYHMTDNHHREDLIKLCSDELLEQLDVPVKMISFGPTERDKVFI